MNVITRLLHVLRVFASIQLDAGKLIGPKHSQFHFFALSCCTFGFSTMQFDDYTCSTMGAKNRRKEICMRHRYNSQKPTHASQTVYQMQEISPVGVKYRINCCVNGRVCSECDLDSALCTLTGSNDEDDG